MSHIVEISKLTEYAVQDQVLSHFEDNNLFHSNHHGFLPSRSTATALLQIYDIFLSNAEEKKITGAIFLDLSAAFDIVDHSILLKKLASYNFSNSTLCFFKSYLSERKQRVQVQSKVSNELDVGCQGVPQGSILGPLLFLIFVNDFPAHSEQGESVMYADDDTEVVSSKDPDILQEKLQNKADSASIWINENKMLCSGEKTKLLIISTKELRRSKLEGKIFRIRVGNELVEETKSEKLLGINLNNDLTWSTHLYGNNRNDIGLLSKLSKRAGILARLNMFMKSNQFSSVCDGLFTSGLLYCLPLFGNVWDLPTMDDTSRRSKAFSTEDCRRLQVIQNKVLRCKTKNFDYRTPTRELLKQTGDLSVHQLIAYHSLLTLARIFFNRKPDYLVTRFGLKKPNSEHVAPSRQLNSIQVYAKLSISRSGFSYRSAKLWNGLPEHLRKLTCMKKFKIEVKDWVKRFVPVKPE